MDQTQNMTYVARCKECGRMVAAMSDNPDMLRELADTVRDWIKAGLTVDRVSVEDVREGFAFCICRGNPRLPGM